MQILKNLYQLSGSLNGLTWCGEYRSYRDANTYLLKTENGSILFDCGCGETFAQIKENMIYWGIDISEIKVCFITHPHYDHAGACSYMREHSIPVYAHKITAEALEKGDERCAGYLYHSDTPPCHIDISFADDTAFDICGVHIETMHCPGHTGGCTAYKFQHEGKNIIVSGDIIGTLMDGHFGWDGSFDYDRSIYLETLIRFSKTDADIMLPGHGLIYFQHPRQRIEEALCVALSEWR